MCEIKIKKRQSILFYLAGICMLSAVLLTACTLGAPTSPAPPSATVTAETDSAAGWTQLVPGIAQRTLSPGTLDQFTVLRVDPAQVRFRVHYRPGEPLSLNEWRDALPDAVAMINANFFDPERNALGLLVVDGVPRSAAYTARGGILAVTGDTVRVRSTVREPYQGEALDQAIQAFPLLVLDGAAVLDEWRGDRNTRRSAIAQDTAGRILLLATPLLGPRLTEMSAALAESDLGIDIAFNLDGGGSTLLYAAGESPVVISSFDPVPAVLAVYAR